MNLDVTRRTVRVLRVKVVLRAGRFGRADAMINAVTFKAELCDRTCPQQPWIT